MPALHSGRLPWPPFVWILVKTWLVSVPLLAAIWEIVRRVWVEDE
jgi:hypothetical protein